MGMFPGRVVVGPEQRPACSVHHADRGQPGPEKKVHLYIRKVSHHPVATASDKEGRFCSTCFVRVSYSRRARRVRDRGGTSVSRVTSR